MSILLLNLVRRGRFGVEQRCGRRRSVDRSPSEKPWRSGGTPASPAPPARGTQRTRRRLATARQEGFWLLGAALLGDACVIQLTPTAGRWSLRLIDSRTYSFVLPAAGAEMPYMRAGDRRRSNARFVRAPVKRR